MPSSPAALTKRPAVTSWAKSLRRSAFGRTLFGSLEGQQWLRVEMDRACNAFLASIDAAATDVLEISGNAYRGRPWRSYRDLWYPEFDLLEPEPVGQFDLVICEQVLEHVAGNPFTAMSNLFDLCRPGGHLLVSTPFLVCIHGQTSDFWRYTPEGLRLMATSAGFEVVDRGSWGNMWCVRANRRADWAVYRPWHRLLKRWSLANDAINPQQVWLVARRPAS